MLGDFRISCNLFTDNRYSLGYQRYLGKLYIRFDWRFCLVSEPMLL